MLRIYWKQALCLLKENKLLSLISILGTALAICMIMVMVITYQIRVKNYSPEDHRDRMLYVRWAGRSAGDKQAGNGFLSLRTVKECFLPLRTPEAVAVVSPWRTRLASLPGGTEKKNCLTLFTDDVFWKVFNFRFLQGAPYTAEEVASGIRKAVITESVARRLYGSSQAVGQTILLDYQAYTVGGVVKDVSSIARSSYSEVWVPYSTFPLPDDTWAESITGWFHVILLARSSADFDAIRQELDHRLAQYNNSLKEYRITLYNQPNTQLERELKGYGTQGTNKAAFILRYLLVIVILLLVPAINLSGMTLSRMRKRLAEIGIRKAFGATRGTLLVQILSENLFLTLLGGMAGLVISYFAVYGMRAWLLSNSFSSITSVFGGTPALAVSELFSPAIFAYAFLFCLVLNLLSAGIPAYRISNRNIIDAFNEN